MNYKEYLKTLIGRRGTLDIPEKGAYDMLKNSSYYKLRFNEANLSQRNAHVLEVQDDFVVIHHDVHGAMKIPLTFLW
ncbi:hypothetical protein SAMN04489760_103144 [Syntrophus gentianae]|uniref:Uncharacterized protein n=1 Tax=Syntrophus gentianae TaxID=43775 RepID=A0A1H7VBP4_9BACT|nr:hypothetical protein [Syntrophus gentianae]SEM06450.1 hypothetical protein SAMN04489760_103144 [Syntrophus gentianae]